MSSSKTPLMEDPKSYSTIIIFNRVVNTIFTAFQAKKKKKTNIYREKVEP